MIIWRGWGIVVLVIGAITGGGGTGIAVALGDSADKANFGTAFGFMIGAVALWFAGSAMNRPKQGFHPQSGQPVVYRNQHSFFLIPVQYWGPIAAVIGIVVLIIRLAT